VFKNLYLAEVSLYLIGHFSNNRQKIRHPHQDYLAYLLIQQLF